jgi:oligoendopeptidase F
MKTKWNLKQLYSDIDDLQIQKDIERSIKEVNKFVSKWKDNKEYMKDPKVLAKALKEYEKLLEEPGICDKPSYYLFLKSSLNKQDTKIKAKQNKLHDISLKLANDIQFFSINISKIPVSKHSLFLKEPLLEKYTNYLKNNFKWAKYTLSDKEERIFNIKSKTSHTNWKKMTSELLSKQTLKVLDEDGNKKEISYNEVSKYLQSTKKKVRDYAAKQLYKVNNRYEEIAEFEINSILENKKINDEYRNIPRPDTSRNLSNGMEDLVVDTLKEVVTQSFDISQRYYKLKAKILKQKKLAYYERTVSVSKLQKEYTFEQSFKLVHRTFEKLDKEFSEILNMYISNGHFDVYPKKGKSGGAYCIDIGGKYPTYILLNHNNKMKDVLTIAHETGHGIHSEYSNKQNPLNQGYSIATAEVASTFFEDFVLDEISKDYSKKEKGELLMEKVGDDISTILRQIACYNFEWELHKSFREEGYLSTEKIAKIFTTCMSEYLGDSVDKDKYMKLGWLGWSHIRRFFYVYSYASGLLVSKYLQNIVKEDPKNIKLVKEFFKAGNSKSTKDIFLDMGIDISKREFWQKGIDEIRENLEELESIY